MPVMENTLGNSILEFEASVVAFHSIYEKTPNIRITFFYSLYIWCRSINEKLVDNLEHLYQGECKEVLSLDYHRLINKAYWLDARTVQYAKNNGHIRLADCGIKLNSNMETFADLYRLYEKEIGEMIGHLKEAKSTFNNLHLYDGFIDKMKEKHSDPHLAYKYESWKEEQVELNMKRLVAMQIQTCVDFLKSGVLQDWVSITNEEVDAVREEELIKWLPSEQRHTKNLKVQWAKLKMFVDIIEDTVIIPKRQCIRKCFLAHVNDINEEHIRAIFRFDYLLSLIHQDMVEHDRKWAKYLAKTDHFAIVNSLTLLMAQPWFEKMRSRDVYDKTWIAQFLNDLMAEYGEAFAKEWEVAKKRTKLKCMVIGAMKDAGILRGGYQTIAEMMELDTNLPDTSLANYLGMGKKMPFFEWICDYVEQS